MRHKDPNHTSKLKIILEGYKLFSTKFLSEITFSDIERATGLSRGAILYHFKTKRLIFIEVINYFFLTPNNTFCMDIEKDLWGNIKAYINYKRQQQEYFMSIGIRNINRAQIYSMLNMIRLLGEKNREVELWFEKELHLWRKMLKIAQKKGEIGKNVDIEMNAKIFFCIFWGNSYISITTPVGYDLHEIQNQLYALYTKLVNH